MRRGRTKGLRAEPSLDGSVSDARVDDGQCWLCARPLGRRVEWHHPRPKSKGGKATVAVHPICHRTIHATFTNVELARFGDSDAALSSRPELKIFLDWIADKAPDFHAPTRRRKAG